MRKLASIKQISAIYPIENKDKIVLAQIDGWQVIVTKDFTIGDKVVFCEIDSVLPPKPEFEFLKNKNYRIKTMKMGGVLSQGICFPLSVLPKGEYNLNDDVTSIMGVTQYEATMDKDDEPTQVTPKEFKHYPKFFTRFKWFRNLVMPKKENKGFPWFIHITDETRIQNCPFYLDEDCDWVATEKVDGQSGSFTLERIKPKFFWQKERFDFAVCSRKLRKWTEDNSSYWSVAKRYNIESVLHQLIGDNDWVAIQGECVASDVQGNKYSVTIPDLYVFNLIYPNGRVDSLKAKEIVNNLGLKFVPIVEPNAHIKGMTVNEVLDYATGKSQLRTDNGLREGVVFRSQDGKQSFKAVSPKFLMHYDE